VEAPEPDAAPVNLDPETRLAAVVFLALVGAFRALGVVFSVGFGLEADALFVEDFA
jgi:hypothetical protein